MKKEKSQLTLHKYKGLQEATTNNYMPIKWTTTKKWTNFGKVQFSKTDPGRIRKYKQTYRK